MPVVATVGTEAHVLGQPVELARPGPVRLVGGDGVGDLVEAWRSRRRPGP